MRYRRCVSVLATTSPGVSSGSSDRPRAGCRERVVAADAWSGAIERYRMLPYDQAKAAMDLAEKEWMRAGPTVDPNYRGHGVQLEFMVEDQKMFTMPWSA